MTNYEHIRLRPTIETYMHPSKRCYLKLKKVFAIKSKLRLATPNHITDDLFFVPKINIGFVILQH